MMKMTRRIMEIVCVSLLGCLVSLIAPVSAASQSTVQVTISGISPILPTPYISDFESNVYNGNYGVLANVSGSIDVIVQFRVRLSLGGEVLVDELSDTRELRSGINSLTPFPDEVFFSTTLSNVLNRLPSNRIRQAFQTGAFPEGTYTLTIEPINAATGAPMGAPVISVFTVLVPQPPQLYAPVNYSVQHVPVPVFSWSSVIAPPGVVVEYDFLLVELHRGQNPGDAIVSNREHTFITITGRTILPYTPDYLPLERGQMYAWQVTARDAAGEMPFNNDGRSNVYVFTFGSDPDEDDDSTPLIGDRLLPDAPDLEMAKTRISGQVNWTFRPADGTTGNEPFGVEPDLFLSTTSNTDIYASGYDPNYLRDDENEGISISGEHEVMVFGGGSSSSVEVGKVSAQLNSLLQEAANNLTTYPYEGASVVALYQSENSNYPQVIANGTTDSEGRFELEFIPSTLYMLARGNTEPEQSGTGLGLPQMENLNIPDQMAGIQLSVPAIENMVFVQIVVNSTHFAFPDTTMVPVRLNSPSNHSAGTITGTALTYRLKPNVISAVTGAELSNALVEIFRQRDWYGTYPSLRHEGAPLPDEERGREVFLDFGPHVKVAEVANNEIATRIFPFKKGFLDRYTVRISAPGYQTQTVFLTADPPVSLTEISTLETTYELHQAPPVVMGRVVRRDTQQPPNGEMIVTLTAEGSPAGSGFSTLTNEAGRFIISDIDTSSTPYILEVSGQRVSTYREELLITSYGQTIEREIQIEPALITVVGRVMNDDGAPVPKAILQWQDGGNPVFSLDDGRFVTANTAGTHVLTFRKIGHRDKEKEIVLEIEDDGSASDWPIFDTESDEFMQAIQSWATSIEQTDSFIEDGQSVGYNLSGAGFNEDGLAANFLDLMGDEGFLGGVTDIGIVIMNRAVGRLRVIVSDENGGFIPGVNVRAGPETSGVTDQEGSIFFNEAPAGTIPVQLIASPLTNFVSKLTEATVADNGEITELQLTMQLGGRAVGTITANGQPLEEATIRVAGRDDIYTTSGSDGTYVLPGIPRGIWELRATKSGYVGHSATSTFTADEIENLNFDLGDAGFDISTLMGFEIEVDEFTIAGDTTITGAFVRVPSNDLFEVAANLRLPFTGIRVYENNGVLMPADGEVVTDRTSFRAKVFDFLHLTISNDDGITVRPRQLFSSIGYVSGTVQIDYATTFTAATGWVWDKETEEHLSLPNTDNLPNELGATELVVLTSDGSFPFPDVGIPDFEFSFGSASRSFSLFGFNIDLNLNESVLRKDGFHMQGDIQLAGIPLLDDGSLTLEKLWIGIDGTIREASIALDPNPRLALAEWEMVLNSAGITEIGLLMGGALLLSIPGSAVSNVTFSQLAISAGQLHGGQFQFPADGIDVMGITRITPLPGKEITFGRVAGQSIYYLMGGAQMELQRLDRKLKFREFLVRTDGQFNANLAANFKADFFGLAELNVTGIGFQNTSNPAIKVNGQFALKGIPFITAQAGGLTYRPNQPVAFDEMELGFDIASIGIAAIGLGLTATGFSGAGLLRINGTPINERIDFFYDGPSSFGASFQAGVGPIPVGSFFITQIGGGFTYNNGFSVTMSGVVEIAPGTGEVVSINPLEVTFSAGPVIQGFANVTVIEETLAEAHLTIDFPNRYFSIGAELNFSALERINTTAEAGVLFVVSGDPFYWLIGVRVEAELLGLFDGNANILAGWNIPANEPNYMNYTSFVRSDFVTGGRIIGLHLDVGVRIGVEREDARCATLTILGAEIGSACGYFLFVSRCQLNIDLAGGNYGLFIGSNIAGGGWLTVAKQMIAGVELEVGFHISGSYINGTWQAGGGASARLLGYLGTCGSGCENRVCWGGVRGCASGAIAVDYNSGRSRPLQISFNLGD